MRHRWSRDRGVAPGVEQWTLRDCAPPRISISNLARGSDVRVGEPFLNLGDVGLMIERIGGGRRAERLRANQGRRIRDDHAGKPSSL
jgi:hypothetical protein